VSTGYWGLVAGFWQLVPGYWFLIPGCWSWADRIRLYRARRIAHGIDVLWPRQYSKLFNPEPLNLEPLIFGLFREKSKG
jgi:hypothetical protein